MPKPKVLNKRNFDWLYEEIEKLNSGKLKALTKDNIKVISYFPERYSYDSSFELEYHELTDSYKATQYDYYVEVSRDPERMIDIIYDGFVYERWRKNGKP